MAVAQKEPRGEPAVISRFRSAARRSAGWLERSPIGALWSRLLEIEFVDRSVALATKLFVSLFPLLIVAASVAPDGVRRQMLDAVAVRCDRRGVDARSGGVLHTRCHPVGHRIRRCPDGPSPRRLLHHRTAARLSACVASTSRRWPGQQATRDDLGAFGIALSSVTFFTGMAFIIVVGSGWSTEPNRCPHRPRPSGCPTCSGSVGSLGWSWRPTGSGVPSGRRSGQVGSSAIRQGMSLFSPRW